MNERFIKTNLVINLKSMNNLVYDIDFINYQLSLLKSLKNKICYLKYCILSEQNKQYLWETRDIRKIHSKNIRFLQNYIAKNFNIIYDWYDYIK